MKIIIARVCHGADCRRAATGEYIVGSVGGELVAGGF